MTSPDPSPTDSSLRRPRPRLLRLWHWLNALAIFGALTTVLLRKTFLSWRTNSQLIETRLAEAGLTIAPEDAVSLAKAIRAPMWEWHYTIGLTLAVLLVVRLVIALLDPAQAPVRTTWQAIRRFSTVPAAEKGGFTHLLLVKLLYVVFYGMLSFMVVSGLSMYYSSTLGLSDGLVGQIKEYHEPAMWFFAVFVPAHIVGVVVAEFRGERGLVSDMINGGSTAESKGEAGA